MSSPPTSAKEKQPSITQYNQQPSGFDDDERSQSGTLDGSRSNTLTPHSNPNKSVLAIENKQFEVLQVLLYCILTFNLWSKSLHQVEQMQTLILYLKDGLVGAQRSPVRMETASK
jgi:hypothetical protein